MSEYSKISDETLNAFVDDELSVEERASVTEAAERDSGLAKRIADYRVDKARIGQVYGRILDEPLPAKWIDLIERAPRRKRLTLSTQVIAAMAATILLAIIGGLTLYREAAPHEEPIIEEALAARDDAMPARQVIAANAAGQAANANRLIASALAMHVKAPDLTRMGYKLAGMRVYGDVPGGKSVELLYRKDSSRIVALYVRHSTGAVRFDQFQQRGLRICIWQDDVLGTVITGKMSAAEMQRLASLAYSGLQA